MMPHHHLPLSPSASKGVLEARTDYLLRALLLLLLLLLDDFGSFWKKYLFSA